MKKTLYIDMDNVLVDFKSGLDKTPEEILEQYPDNKVAQVYCDRLKLLIQNPPTEWQGVWKLAQK